MALMLSIALQIYFNNYFCFHVYYTQLQEHMNIIHKVLEKVSLMDKVMILHYWNGIFKEN